MLFFFFFKQTPAYEIRISDWSSDVCPSDLAGDPVLAAVQHIAVAALVGPRGHLGGGAAGAGLGDADGRLVAGEHLLRRQALLRLAAVGHDGAEDRKSTRLNSSH